MRSSSSSGPASTKNRGTHAAGDPAQRLLRPARGELGERFDAVVADRLHTIGGDVGRDGLALDAAGRALLGSCDIVIHAAAAVTFDAPLDGAVEVNLLGPTRVAETLQELAGERAAGEGAAEALPHLIAVSTAYVNSGHKGDAAEELINSSKFVSKIDWRAEVRAARRARADEDAVSRSPERLAAFHPRRGQSSGLPVRLYWRRRQSS